MRRFARRVMFVSIAALFASVQDAPAQCGDAADPQGITASDALVVLRTAVRLQDCSRCTCDTDGSGAITATDALFTLKAAVGQSITMKCPFCCANCGCTPRTLTLTMSEVMPCDGCIPRVPVSSSAANGVIVTFAQDVNGTYTLEPVADCIWQSVVPDAISEKQYFQAPDCSGSSTSAADIDVVFRVVRSAAGWEVYAGQYAGDARQWGDVLRATIVSDACDVGDAAVNQNVVCELADVPDQADYDVHGTGGGVTVAVSDPAPVCW